MKKLLLVSVTAMFAAMPMLANAATVPGAADVAEGIQDGIATTRYVKGAYNALRAPVAAINTAITVTGAVSGDHITDGDGVAENLKSLNTAIKAIESNSVGTIATGNYVVSGQSVGTNLGNLDTAIGAVRTTGNHYLTKSTGEGTTKNVAGNLEALDDQIYANTTEIGTFDSNGSGTYVSDANTVHQNLQALDAQVTTNTTNIGTVGSLTTSAKTNLVGAINELDSDIGNLATLSDNAGLDGTGAKANVVAAINAVAATVAASNTDATVNDGNYIGTNNGKTVGTVSAALSALDTAVKNNEDHIGNVANLDGTNDGVTNLVTAINNVDNKVLTAYNDWNNGGALTQNSSKVEVELALPVPVVVP